MTSMGAVLGQDLGDQTTVATLGYINPDEKLIEIRRVENSAGSHGLQNPNINGHIATDFIASATLEHAPGGLLARQPSPNNNLRFPIRLLLLFRSGVPHDFMPEGPALREAYHAGQITDDTLDETIMTHFRLIKESAMQKSNHLNLHIRMIALSHPGFLGAYYRDAHREGHVGKYMGKYRELMRKVWGEGMSFVGSSEEQACARYVASPFEDQLTANDRKSVWDTHLNNLTSFPGTVKLLILRQGETDLIMYRVNVDFDGGEWSTTRADFHGNWIKLSKDPLEDCVREFVQSQGDNRAIVFSGGNWGAPALRKKAIDALIKSAIAGTSMTGRYVFLGDYSHNQSVVSVGLAVNGCKRYQDEPFLMLDGSAIAMKRERMKKEAGLVERPKFLLSKVTSTVNVNETADKLTHTKGCVKPPTVTFEAALGHPVATNYKLVCDPNYYQGGNFPEAPTEFTPVGELYDLHFSIDGSQCPANPVCWTMVGPVALDLARRPPVSNGERKDPMVLYLVCHAERNGEITYDANSKFWPLELAIDVTSSQLRIKEGPPCAGYKAWCVECHGQLSGENKCYFNSVVSYCEPCFDRAHGNRGDDCEQWQELGPRILTG